MSNYKERPCAGCGISGRRPAETLCHNCSLKLREYNLMSDSYRRMSGSELTTFGFFNNIPLPLARGIKKGDPTTERFRLALSTFVDALSPISRGGGGWLVQSNAPNDGPNAGCGHISTHIFKADHIFHEAFNEFLASLRLLANDIFNEGERSGQNLLKQLNDGSISTKEFEERKNRN